VFINRIVRNGNGHWIVTSYTLVTSRGRDGIIRHAIISDNITSPSWNSTFASLNSSISFAVMMGHYQEKNKHNRSNHETIPFLVIITTRDKPRWSIQTTTGNIIPRISLRVFVIGGIVHSWSLLFLLLLRVNGGWRMQFRWEILLRIT